jgi:hypothetical protein
MGLTRFAIEMLAARQPTHPGVTGHPSDLAFPAAGADIAMFHLCHVKDSFLFSILGFLF